MTRPAAPPADTRSPWTDAFRAKPGAAAATPAACDAPRPGTASDPQAPQPTVEPLTDRWTCEALFDLYNPR